MNKLCLTLLVGLIATFSVNTVSADLITQIFTLAGGSINGQNVGGETVTMKVNFTDDQPFSGGVIDLTSPTVTFSITNFNGGAEFSHDTQFSQMRFGSTFNGLHLSLIDSTVNQGGSLDTDEVSTPNDGDTLADYFATHGDGATINYTSDNRFSLFEARQTVDGGKVVNSRVLANRISADQVIFSPVPEPTTPLAFVAGGILFGLICRRRS